MRNLILFAGALLAACGGSGGAPDNPPPPPPPAGDLTMISAVQGNGPTSPLAGSTVTIRGIVTGDFQDGDDDTLRDLGGFYVQDGPPDLDLATSDGVFVFDGSNPAVDIDAGDVVQVTGTVTEHFGETQITADSVRVVGAGDTVARPLSLSVHGTVTNSDGELVVDLERYEGMLIRFPASLSVTNLRNLERYGEVTLSSDGRLYQYTNGNAPDVAGYQAHAADNARRSIVLDDGRREQNPADVTYLTAGDIPGYSIRTGDAVTELTGVLRYSRGSGSNGTETWRLMPTIDPSFESLNPRPGAPDIAGALRVASFNVLNFFTTVDNGQDLCGPQGTSGCRGADSNLELARQLQKTVAALAMMGADVVGLIELENNASTSLATLVDALNERLGTTAYAYVDTGVIHDDAIKTGFIYRPAAVSPVGEFALLDRSVDSRFNDARNRPALAQSFRVDATGSVFTVVVLHLKSKGSPCDADGDANTGDGQGNCNLTRNNAAAALADWIRSDPTGSGDPDTLIVGDLNAYTREDPLQTLKSAGFVNLLDSETTPYSFVFDAQAGALDHALVSPSLAPQVAGHMEWHINADEPPLLDYNLEFGRDPTLFDASVPYRASDHDPVIVGLDLSN